MMKKSSTKSLRAPKGQASESVSKIVFGGWLRKRGEGGKLHSRKFARRWIELREGENGANLTYFKNKGDVRARGVVALGAAWRVALTERTEGMGFENGGSERAEAEFTLSGASSSSRTFVFRTGVSQASRWVKALENSISKLEDEGTRGRISTEGDMFEILRTAELSEVQRADGGLAMGKETWNVVPSSWVQEWANFCCNGGERPAAIDSAHLIKAVAEDDCKLEAVKDYRVVNDAVWSLYEEWYGGGPRIRTVVTGEKINEKIVPVWQSPSDWQIASASSAASSSSALSVEISLLPHVHNEFCERKQHVCGAGDEYRQGETVAVRASGDDEANSISIEFGRCDPSHQDSEIVSIYRSGVDDNRTAHLKMQREHVGQMICARAQRGSERSAWARVGPVVPSPPKMSNVRIEIEDSTLIATGEYRGGEEGHSQWSFIKILPSGERQVIKHSVPSREHIHPVHLSISAKDNGCLFKARCKPQRADGVYGEVVTSKPTNPVAI